MQSCPACGVHWCACSVCWPRSRGFVPAAEPPADLAGRAGCAGIT
jgi:hypothetical protein